MISVIVPVKDGEPFLSDAFDGLLSQTYRNFEVCIYNDGSKDRTAEIVDNYARKFAAKGIQCYHSSGKESKGVGYSKAAAVRLATSNSRFLCFNDADDVSLPNRLELQLAACLNSFNPDNCFVGSKFTRLPENSTERYSNWACSLTDEQLYNQIYTFFGPTLVAPVWFLSKRLYRRAGPFKQDVPTGYPEDLEFFYRALRLRPMLIRVDESLVVYRYHSSCATLSVSEEIMWNLRVAQLEYNLLDHVDSFSIWDIGRRGRKLFRSLSSENREKVTAYCDLNAKRLAKVYCEIFDDENRWPIARIPAKSPREVKTPVVICEKMEFIKEAFEVLVAERNWREGKDFVLLN